MPVNGDTRSIAANLMSWARGVDAPNRASKVVVIEDASLLPDVGRHEFLTPATAVFVPGAAQTPGSGQPLAVSNGGQVFSYVGDFRDPDADIQVGEDFYVQQQSYAVSEFVPVGGPTILRACSDIDVAAFYRDADTARSAGKFPAALLHPQSLLGDMPSLGFRPGSPEVSHIYVAGSGEVLTSPSGIPLGILGDSDRRWSRSWVSGITEVGLRPEVADRPWISHYMLAADALRHAAVRGLQDMRVSGFGGHLVPALDGTEVRVPGQSSLLLFNSSVAHLHDGATSKTYRLGSDAAKFVDVMLAIGSDAAEAARILGCPESVAEESIRQIENSFNAKGIRFGSVHAAGL